MQKDPLLPPSPRSSPPSFPATADVTVTVVDVVIVVVVGGFPPIPPFKFDCCVLLICEGLIDVVDARVMVMGQRGAQCTASTQCLAEQFLQLDLTGWWQIL